MGSFSDEQMIEHVIHWKCQFCVPGVEVVMPTVGFIGRLTKLREVEKRKGVEDWQERVKLNAELWQALDGADLVFVANMPAGLEHIGIGTSAAIGYAVNAYKKIVFEVRPTDEIHEILVASGRAEIWRGPRGSLFDEAFGHLGGGTRASGNGKKTVEPDEPGASP